MDASPYLLFSLLLATLHNFAGAIQCYNCTSSSGIECSENFDIKNTALKPVTCEVYGAKYCIKTTGIFGGEIGTQRFCSSRDYGNICQYIRRKGDDRDYRSCIYTCSTDGCNASVRETLNAALIFTLFTFLLPLM